MAKHAELDVILRWASDGRFDVTILFDVLGNIEDYQYFNTDPIQVDLDRVDGLCGDVKSHSVALGQLLFRHGASLYLNRTLRLTQEMPARMRLVVNDDKPLRYRTLRCERLRHPISKVRVMTSENITFCRCLSSADGTPPSPLGLRDQLALSWSSRAQNCVYCFPRDAPEPNLVGNARPPRRPERKALPTIAGMARVGDTGEAAMQVRSRPSRRATSCGGAG